jgi:hypothetical protein
MQTSIAMDGDTRDRAAKRAKAEHIPLALVVRILLNDYADGRLSIGTRAELDVVSEEISVDAKTQKKMDTAVKKWRGKISA